MVNEKYRIFNGLLKLTGFLNSRLFCLLLESIFESNKLTQFFGLFKGQIIYFPNKYMYVLQ